MGPSKKIRREKFIKRYKASTEKYRLKMQFYANKCRLRDWKRKIENQNRCKISGLLD